MFAVISSHLVTDAQSKESGEEIHDVRVFGTVEAANAHAHGALGRFSGLKKKFEDRDVRAHTDGETYYNFFRVRVYDAEGNMTLHLNSYGKATALQ